MPDSGNHVAVSVAEAEHVLGISTRCCTCNKLHLQPVTQFSATGAENSPVVTRVLSSNEPGTVVGSAEERPHNAPVGD
jgi:hypothetical protein